MANQEIFRFNIPPGRVVSGTPTTWQTKDQHGKPKDHPNIYFAVACPKNSPAAPQQGGFVASLDQVLDQLLQLARRGYAHDQSILAEVNRLLAGRFSWKIEDGDTAENQKKEGWKGCWVFKFSTTLGVPACYDAHNQPFNAELIKTGHWVDVAASCSINEQKGDRAGIYMNPDVVRFIGYDKEIRLGPNAEQAFGGPAAYIPPGVSASPVSPGGTPGGAGGTWGPGAPQQNPTPVAAPAAQPQTGGWGPAQGGAPGTSAGTVSPSSVAEQYPGARPHTGWGQ